MKLFLIPKTILFMFSLFLFGCCSPLCYQLSRDEKLADKITENTAKQLKAQKNLCLVGTGGQMMDDIQMMAMSFDYYQEVDVTISRELLVCAINEYLSAINDNKEIRPYLHEYPFTAKNIEIRIFIYNPDRSEVSMEKIACITALNGMLEYYTRSDFWQPIYHESYEQALQEMTLSQGAMASKTVQSNGSTSAIISKAVAKDGAKVNIKVTSLECSMFELNGEGFKPYEALNVISNSCGEILHSQVTADKNGNILPIGLLPTVIGKSGGVCYIEILREEGSIHIKLPWGTEILKTN